MHRLKNTEIVRTIRLLRLIEDSQDDLTISDIADALKYRRLQSQGYSRNCITLMW